MISHKIVKKAETKEFINSIFKNPDISRYREIRINNIPMIIMDYLLPSTPLINNKMLFEIVQLYEYYLNIHN